MSHTDEYVSMLKARVESANSIQEARESLDQMELYGYRAIPALRDIFQTSQNKEVKEYCREIIKRLGWITSDD